MIESLEPEITASEKQITENFYGYLCEQMEILRQALSKDVPMRKPLIDACRKITKDAKIIEVSLMYPSDRG